MRQRRAIKSKYIHIDQNSPAFLSHRPQYTMRTRRSRGELVLAEDQANGGVVLVEDLANREVTFDKRSSGAYE